MVRRCRLSGPRRPRSCGILVGPTAQSYSHIGAGVRQTGPGSSQCGAARCGLPVCSRHIAQVCPVIAAPDGSLPALQSVACGHSSSRRRCRLPCREQKKKNSVWGRCASRIPGFLSGGSLYVSKRTFADPQIGHPSKW
eukprot:scaffold5231_cov119-Isochrysis_galbana.AAC.1